MSKGVLAKSCGYGVCKAEIRKAPTVKISVGRKSLTVSLRDHNISTTGDFLDDFNPKTLRLDKKMIAKFYSFTLGFNRPVKFPRILNLFGATDLESLLCRLRHKFSAPNKLNLKLLFKAKDGKEEMEFISNHKERSDGTISVTFSDDTAKALQEIYISVCHPVNPRCK